ncbi:MAG: isoprenylcysteine carboxylmethyltransferase family protein [Halioglobus sp.]
MSRLIVLLYGVVSYLLGVLGLLGIIAALPGYVPWGFMYEGVREWNHPVAWNLGLVFLWGVVHSVMARPSFKAIITKLIPEPAERPTYVLIAGLSSIAMVGYWATVPGTLWQIEMVWAEIALWSLFGFSWVLCIGSTFAINHFDLFGLRQVFMHYKNLERAPLAFVQRTIYEYVRHPIQTGVLVGVWATPVMTNTQLVLSVGFTAYIFIGLWFEERDLIAVHGSSYLQYRAKVGKLFPKLGGRN